MAQEIPAGLLALIQARVGDEIRFSSTAARGNSSDATVLIDSEHGSFFVKAMRNRPGGRLDSLLREEAINPFIRPVAPAMRWRAEDDDWVVLGFDAVDGRSSDFAPGSADLPAVIDVFNRIANLELPEVARDWRESRWDRFAADAEEAELFKGDGLLYTDPHPGNLMVGARTAWAVGWSWPTRGAAFITPASFAFQLIVHGHSPESAELHASHCAAWRVADSRAIDAFAAAYTRLHRWLRLQRPGESWISAMADASETWAEHRGVAP
ncbi:hypothetical protein [Actinomadura atramentaria]|uniref:hypothetical protein n=1 Tax=Actinomadura atramentaria TaxID=1990 RepID=UPI00037E6DAA|nr:hypothetical protein [Actinomadura atramentaria]